MDFIVKKVFGLLLLGLLLFGCVESGSPAEGWQPEGVSVAPSIEAEPSPEPSPSIEAEPSPSPSPSPTPSAEPTEEPEPTPEPSPEPEASCSITLQSLGEVEKRIIVDFEDYGGVAGEVQCTPAGSWHEIELNTQQMGYYDCIFEQEATETAYTVTARGGTTECSVTAHIPATTLYSSFTVSPPNEDPFTMNKTTSNSTMRDYTITNTGDAQLTGIICNSSETWAPITCPSSIAYGTSLNASVLFDSTGLSADSYSVVLTFNAEGAESFGVGVVITVIEG